jgi:hypothetical protein
MLKNAQVLPFVYNTEEYFRFKVDTIKWVNSRLADPALAINDATIGSILLLSCFEVSILNCSICSTFYGNANDSQWLESICDYYALLTMTHRWVEKILQNLYIISTASSEL